MILQLWVDEKGGRKFSHPMYRLAIIRYRWQNAILYSGISFLQITASVDSVNESKLGLILLCNIFYFFIYQYAIR